MSRKGIPTKDAYNDVIPALRAALGQEITMFFTNEAAAINFVKRANTYRVKDRETSAVIHQGTSRAGTSVFDVLVISRKPGADFVVIKQRELGVLRILGKDGQEIHLTEDVPINISEDELKKIAPVPYKPKPAISGKEALRTHEMPTSVEHALEIAKRQVTFKGELTPPAGVDDIETGDAE